MHAWGLGQVYKQLKEGSQEWEEWEVEVDAELDWLEGELRMLEMGIHQAEEMQEGLRREGRWRGVDVERVLREGSALTAEGGGEDGLEVEEL